MLIDAAAPATARGASPITGRATAALGVAILTLGILSGTGIRLVFSPVQELAKAELALSDFQLGLLQGLATALPAALLSVPLGRLTDRSNRVRLLAALAFVSTLGAALTGVARDMEMLFVARMLAGMFSICALPVAISLVADLVPPDRRGRALLFLQTGQMAGTGLAFALGGGIVGSLVETRFPLLGTLAPWRQVQLLFGGFGLLSLLALSLLREPARREVVAGTHIPLRAALAGIWARRRFIVPLLLGQLTVVMADGAAGIWAAPVLTRDHGLQPGDFAGWMGLVMLLSGLIGATIGGVAADYGEKGRIPGGMLGGAIVAALCAIPAAFFAVSPGVPLFACGLAVLLACGSVTGIITSTAIAVHMPNELRGLCLGLFIVFGALIGLGIAPMIVPFISGLLGGERHIGASLAILTASTSALALIGFLSAIRHMPRGLEGS